MASDREEGVLTVAAVREKDGLVLFNERARVFRLPETKRRRGLLRVLAGARRSHAPLRAVLGAEDDVLLQAVPLAKDEALEFHRARKTLKNPEKPRKIDVAKLDPTTFNIVGYSWSAAALTRCLPEVPSYAKAKEIFDYCAQQSCHLPGSTVENPCIPFQYVRDGCYARAHKMRKIIKEKYGYCCTKVFSFANQNSDTLAVRADKWGGCCVQWWYHVAPLIKLRIKIFGIKLSISLVIDPGMFDKPVLLTSWLYAQENTACASNARVSMYTITDGGAYAPANYQGTAFSTDNAYTATDATLTAYQSLTTCP
jgi:hypothetical protein